MKELSIEDKAKAYDKAFEKARLFMDTGMDKTYEDKLVEIFPELKESEDDRLRKELVEFLNDLYVRGKNANFNRFMKSDISDWICWLEKQAEQKPVDIDYGNAFDEFISHIPEKDPDSCNSLYTYEDIEAAIKFGIQWHKQQKRHVYYDIIEQTFNKSKTYEFPENADAVTYSESILPTSVYKGENDDEYKMHKIIEAAYIEGKKQNQKPVVWTEEDDVYIQYAIDGLTAYINEHPDPEFGNSTPCEKAAVRWLKSLKKRIKK